MRPLFHHIYFLALSIHAVKAKAEQTQMHELKKCGGHLKSSYINMSAKGESFKVDGSEPIEIPTQILFTLDMF